MNNGLTFRPCSSLLTSSLWRRSCSLCKYSCRWFRFVAVLVSFSWRRTLPWLWSSSLRAFCSALWHWRLLASRCCWALSRFCASWLFFFSPKTFLTTYSRFTAELQPWLALLCCLTEKCYSSLFTSSEDGAVAFTREILVYSGSLHLIIGVRFCF